NDPDGRRGHDRRAPPGEQGGEFLGAPGRGDTDGEPGQRAARIRNRHAGTPSAAMTTGSSETETRPPSTRTAYTGSDSVASSRHRPSSSENACFSSGDATTGSPPRSPTIPRDITAARPKGSILPTAYSVPSGSRNRAAWAPPGSSTATPRPGIR